MSVKIWRCLHGGIYSLLLSVFFRFFSLSFKGHDLTFGKHMILQLYKIATVGLKGMYLEHGNGVISLSLSLTWCC